MPWYLGVTAAARRTLIGYTDEVWVVTPKGATIMASNEGGNVHFLRVENYKD